MFQLLAFAVALNHGSNIEAAYDNCLSKAMESSSWTKQAFVDKWGFSRGRGGQVFLYYFMTKHSDPDPFAKVLPGLPDRSEDYVMMTEEAAFPHYIDRQSGAEIPGHEADTPSVVVLSELDNLARYGYYDSSFWPKGAKEGEDSGAINEFKPLAQKLHWKSNGGAWYVFTESLDAFAGRMTPNGIRSKDPIALDCLYLGKDDQDRPIAAVSVYHGVKLSPAKLITNFASKSNDQYWNASVSDTALPEYSSVSSVAFGRILWNAFGLKLLRGRDSMVVPFPDALSYLKSLANHPGENVTTPASVEVMSLIPKPTPKPGAGSRSGLRTGRGG